MESANGSPERTNRRRSASEKELVVAAMEEQPEPLLCAAAAWTRAPTSPQACTGSSASRAPPIPRWPAWPPPGFAHASLAPCARRSPTAGPRRREPLPLLHALCAAPGTPPRALPGPRARRVLLSCASAARGSAGGGSRSAGCRCCGEPARHARRPGRSRAAGLRRPHGAGAEEEMKVRGRIEEGSAWEGQCANMLSTLDPTWRST